MTDKHDLWIQQVLQSELETVKVTNAAIYKQQPGSNVYFYTNKADALAVCKLEQSRLKKKLEAAAK